MSDYINKKCTGCCVVNKEINPIGGIILETEKFVLAQDAEVPIKGFLIIQSKRHTNSLSNFTENERKELIELIYKSELALKKLNICSEVTIVQEERSQHFHVWIYPCHEWMIQKFGKGIQYFREINKYVIENYTEKDINEVKYTIEKIKEYFTKNK